MLLTYFTYTIYSISETVKLSTDNKDDYEQSNSRVGASVIGELVAGDISVREGTEFTLPYALEDINEGFARQYISCYAGSNKLK